MRHIHASNCSSTARTMLGQCDQQLICDDTNIHTTQSYYN